MLNAFRRTYMWRAVLPTDPSVLHLTESGVKLTKILDKDGVEWLEYCSDDVGQCEIRGELSKDATVWTNADGTINKPIIMFEQGEQFALRGAYRILFCTMVLETLKALVAAGSTRLHECQRVAVL